MDTRKRQKIARLIQKEMGETFRPFMQQLRGVLASVTLVRVTSDLSRVHTYLSIFPLERVDELLKYIRDNAGSCHYEPGRRMGQQLRAIPEMEYHIDDSLDYLECIDKLLGQ